MRCVLIWYSRDWTLTNGLSVMEEHVSAWRLTDLLMLHARLVLHADTGRRGKGNSAAVFDPAVHPQPPVQSVAPAVRSIPRCRCDPPQRAKHTRPWPFQSASRSDLITRAKHLVSLRLPNRHFGCFIWMNKLLYLSLVHSTVTELFSSHSDIK